MGRKRYHSVCCRRAPFDFENNARVFDTDAVFRKRRVNSVSDIRATGSSMRLSSSLLYAHGKLRFQACSFNLVDDPVPVPMVSTATGEPGSLDSRNCLSAPRSCSIRLSKILPVAWSSIDENVHRLCESKAEGMNNTIKLIKRVAYGFGEDEYFLLRICHAFPGIRR